MTELLDAVKLPGSLLVAVLIFGFVPGFVLRIAVLLYPRGDERRRELLAELYAMPRIVRPFWVAEQFETALFEGSKERIEARKSRREKKSPEHDLVVEQTAGEYLSVPEATHIDAVALKTARDPAAARELARRLKEFYSA
ncbi:hypothetical protein ACWEF6_31205 [Amycolatopsis sp. NPDC004772]